VEKDSSISNNRAIIQSVEQIVRDSIEAMDSVRRKYDTPAKAREFLLKIGILEKHKRSKNGVRLAKRFR